MKRAVIVTLLFTYALSAQMDDHQALMSAKSLKCTFPWVAAAQWDRDEPAPRVRKNQDFTFQVDGINFGKGTARIIGNAGSDDLLAMKGENVIHFLERTPSGNLNVTSVWVWRSRSGRFKAVHSRHISTGVHAPDVSVGGPFPSQNYGYCQQWQ